MAFRPSLLIAAALSSGACAHAQTPPEPGVLTAEQRAECETLDADFARTGKVLKMVRAFTGPDGKSKIETVEVKGESGVYYGGKVSLTQFGFGDPTKMVIVYGHPNMEIPPHPSPYREIFLILSGSSTVTLADGTSIELKPGSMLLSEDQTSTAGRGGTSGPCGYVAVDFQYKDAPPK